jgi:hypothetical protein
MLKRAEMPCWKCNKEPQAGDTRHWLSSCSDEDFESKHSPGGWPMMCCRVQTVVTMAPNDLAAKRATTPGW